jgi:hypothetical protein
MPQCQAKYLPDQFPIEDTVPPSYIPLDLIKEESIESSQQHTILNSKRLHSL